MKPSTAPMTVKPISARDTSLRLFSDSMIAFILILFSVMMGDGPSGKSALGIELEEAREASANGGGALLMIFFCEVHNKKGKLQANNSTRTTTRPWTTTNRHHPQTQQ